MPEGASHPACLSVIPVNRNDSFMWVAFLRYLPPLVRPAEASIAGFDPVAKAGRCAGNSLESHVD